MNDDYLVSRGQEILSERVKVIESSGIRRVFDLGAKAINPINFSIGQPDFPAPAAVREAAKRAIDEGKSGYTPTQGIDPLRAGIAEKLNRDNHVPCTMDDVLITAGSSGGLLLAMSAVLDPGDEIIIPDPYFVSYIQLARFLGANPILVDTYPDFQVDPSRLADAITPRTKAIMLNTPNNPTGAVYPAETLKEIASIAERNGVLIISDEVYEDYIYDGLRHFSIGSVYPFTVTINAFSKSHALTGWRIGYAAAPKAIISKMAELQQYTFVCAPSFAQFAMLEALKMGPAEEISTYESRRDLAYSLLSQTFEVTKPQGSFYIMPEMRGLDTNDFVEKSIASNVLIIPGEIFSERNTNIRLSYSTNEDAIRRGIGILSKLARG